MRHGPGVQVWPDNAKYEGEWRENKANGRGKFWHADGDIYEGEWEDDKANGFGIYIHVNGAQYEGYWKNNLKHGEGKLELISLGDEEKIYHLLNENLLLSRD